MLATREMQNIRVSSMTHPAPHFPSRLLNTLKFTFFNSPLSVPVALKQFFSNHPSGSRLTPEDSGPRRAVAIEAPPHTMCVFAHRTPCAPAPATPGCADGAGGAGAPVSYFTTLTSP